MASGTKHARRCSRAGAAAFFRSIGCCTRRASSTPRFVHSPSLYDACTKAPICSLAALKFCASVGVKNPRASKSRTIVPVVVHRPQ